MSNSITSLNNYLQDKGKLHLLNFVDSSSGPCHAVVWTVECKVDGEVKGTGTGASKAEAKHIAARFALAAFFYTLALDYSET